MRCKKETLILLYSGVVNELDVQLLHQRVRFSSDSTWSESIFNVPDAIEIDEERIDLTVFCCSAIAICCTPTGPIILFAMFSVVRACTE